MTNNSHELSEIPVNTDIPVNTNIPVNPDIKESPKDGQSAPSQVPLPPNWNYEMTVSEIETIISRIELGELELADVFDQFSTAVEQLRQCEAFLVRQQQQVDLLIETLLDEPEGF